MRGASINLIRGFNGSVVVLFDVGDERTDERLALVVGEQGQGYLRVASVERVRLDKEGEDSWDDRDRSCVGVDVDTRYVRVSEDQ